MAAPVVWSPTGDGGRAGAGPWSKYRDDGHQGRWDQASYHLPPGNPEVAAEMTGRPLEELAAVCDEIVEERAPDGDGLLRLALALERAGRYDRCTACGAPNDTLGWARPRRRCRRCERERE